MDELFPIILIIIFIATIFYFEQNAKNEAFRRIRQDLKRRNLKPVNISQRSYSTFNSKGRYYEVEYINSNSEVYRASCQFGSNWQLFWTEPFFRYRLSTAQTESIRLGTNSADETALIAPKTEKERLIDGLKSNYKYERIGTAKNIRDMEAVDDQVMFILKELSISDPEPEVREAARSAIQSIN